MPAARFALRDRAVLVLATLAVITHLYLLVVAVAIPQSSPDTQLYHLPRAALWKQQHAVAYVRDVPDERVDASPPVAEIQIAATMILSGGDRFTTLVQLAAMIASCLAIAGIARRLGLGVTEAAFGAVAFSTFTIVVLQTPTALNDLALAASLVVCAYFATGRSRADLVLAALALAVAVGTKLTTIFVLPVLVLFVLAATPRSRWPALGVAGVAGIAAGSLWYVVNVVETGKLDGGLSAASPQIADHALGPTLERIGMLSRDFLEMSGAEGGGWLRSPTPGVIAALALLVVSAALFLARRRRAAAVAALAAVSTVVLYPMLATWVVVAGRAARQVLVTARLSDVAPARRVPLQLYESNIHSAYGIAFLVLFIWVGAIVVRDVTRRRLPLAAAVAIASPLLFILILALSLDYDPIRIRFVAFPVALATAVLGICVRIRPLAWSAVGLTAATLVDSRGVLHPASRGTRAAPRESQPRELGALVRAGGRRRGRRGCVSLPRGADPRGRVGRARPRSQHVHLPGLGLAPEADRALRPGDGRRPWRRGVARGRAVQGGRREPSRGGGVEARARVAATVADLRALGWVDMCRNIKTLHNFEPPASEDEVRAAALQYVRKVSGTQKPSKANEAAFARAVDEVAHITSHLLAELVTSAPPRDRDVEAARARARAEKRFGQAA